MAGGAAAVAALWLLQGCEDDNSNNHADGAIDAAQDGVNADGEGADQSNSDGGGETGPNNVPVDGGMTDPGTSQRPPQGELNMDAWLAAGHYKSWSCESGIQFERGQSDHGKNRVCANGLASSNGGGEYAVGSALVLELYDNADQLLGQAMQLHTKAGTDPSTWYWYEKLNRVKMVDATGAAAGACSTCHATAGVPGGPNADLGHDFVFVQ